MCVCMLCKCGQPRRALPRPPATPPVLPELHACPPTPRPRRPRGHPVSCGGAAAPHTCLLPATSQAAGTVAAASCPAVRTSRPCRRREPGSSLEPLLPPCEARVLTVSTFSSAGDQALMHPQGGRTLEEATPPGCCSHGFWAPGTPVGWGGWGCGGGRGLLLLLGTPGS